MYTYISLNLKSKLLMYSVKSGGKKRHHLPSYFSSAARPLHYTTTESVSTMCVFFTKAIFSKNCPMIELQKVRT